MDEFVKGFDIKWTPAMQAGYERQLAKGSVIGVAYDPERNEYYPAYFGMEDACEVWGYELYRP